MLGVQQAGSGASMVVLPAVARRAHGGRVMAHGWGPAPSEGGGAGGSKSRSPCFLVSNGGGSPLTLWWLEFGPTEESRAREVLEWLFP